jgi:hypothetical protein
MEEIKKYWMLIGQDLINISKEPTISNLMRTFGAPRALSIYIPSYLNWTMIHILPTCRCMYGFLSRIYKSELLSVRGIRNRLSSCHVCGFVRFQLGETVHEAVQLSAWPADHRCLSCHYEWDWPSWYLLEHAYDIFFWHAFLILCFAIGT